MIQKTKLKNYQSHKDSELEFDPRFNAIVGTSDSGKSAIIRALTSVIENDFPLSNIHNDFKLESGNVQKSDEVSATVEFDNGVITRTRREDYNAYIANDKEFTNIGRTIPKDVKAVSNLDEINFQDQASSFFLFNQSGSDVNKFINQFVNLDIIDEMFTVINKDFHKLNAKEKQKIADSLAKEKELEKFEDVPKMDKLINELEELEATIEKLDNDIKVAEVVEKELTAIEVNLNQSGYIEESAKKIKELDNLLTEINNKIAEYDKVEALRKGIDTALFHLKTKPLKGVEEIKALEKLLIVIEEKQNNLNSLTKLEKNLTNSLNVLKDCEKVPDTKKLEALLQKIETQDKEVKGMRKVLDGITNSQNSLRSIVKEIRTLKEQLPDVCPFCGAAMEEKDAV